MSYADLHLHTKHSDGEWTPRKVVREAAIARVSCIAITDHDQTGGLPEAIEAGADFGIRVLSGVELSTFDGTDRHVLGYGFDPSAESLRILNEGAQADRFVRAERICERLAALGVPVELDAVLAEAGDAAPGRPHVARALVRARHVRTIREAFDVWLGDGKPACVEKRRVEPREAIRVLHEAGGVAVAAHPGIVGGPETLDPLVEAGLDGVEVKHPLHGDRSEAAFDEYALGHGLVRTGGSDFHGPRLGGVSVGTVAISEEWWGALLERINERRAAVGRAELAV